MEGDPRKVKDMLPSVASGEDCTEILKSSSRILPFRLGQIMLASCLALKTLSPIEANSFVLSLPKYAWYAIQNPIQ